jgi:uncharacterized protein (DUF2267 family)
MNASGLEVWDKSIRTTNIWLDEIMSAAGSNRQAAWQALGAVLRTLRDRLPMEVAAHLGAQLPLLVRGAYFEQWHDPAHTLRLRSIDEFVDLVDQRLGYTRMDPVLITAAVFRTLAQHIDEGQIAKVFAVLPGSIRTALSVAAED